MFIALTLFLAISLIIINIVSSYFVMKSIEDEISKNCISKLKVAENVVVRLKDSIARETVRLSAMAEISDLQIIQKKKQVECKDLFILSKALEPISHLINTDSIYHSIYIYLEDLDRIITTNKGFEYLSDLTDNGWIEPYINYKNNKTSLTWIETRFPGNREKRDTWPHEHVMTYIYPLTPYTTPLRGAIVVNIRENAISSQINSNNFNSEGYMLIIDGEGNVISHVNKELLCCDISDKEYIRSIIDSSSREGYLVAEVDGSKALVSYLKMDDADWIYIGVFSLDSLVNKSSKIRMNTIYISILVLVVGSLTAFYISQKLSSPLKKLIQDISINREIDITNNDEMTILYKAFTTLKKDHENLFDILGNNRKRIEDSYLYDLIIGNVECKKERENVDIGFIYSYYTSAVISIDNYKEFNELYQPEQQFYIKMLILEVCEQVVSESFVCKGINIDAGNIALVINHSLEEDWRQIFKQRLRSVQTEITKAINYTISIGVGKSYSNKNQISNSYSQALEALKFKLKYGYGKIIFWDKELVEYEYYYPFDIERHIINQLDSIDKEGISATVTLLIDELKSRKGLSYDNIMQILNQLIGNTIIKYLTGSHINKAHLFGSQFNVYKELASKETLDDVEIWLVEIYNTITDYCQNMERNETNNFDMIMNFIRQNYKKDIGINDIAEYADLSYSHVRKIFKDETGVNITDYINTIRISEAKTLLAHTDRSINSIASDLGYNNSQSFFRTFKKLEGITPGEYREKKLDEC